jgi:hypothetical protein
MTAVKMTVLTTEVAILRSFVVVLYIVLSSNNKKSSSVTKVMMKTRTAGLTALAGRGWYATKVKEFAHHRLKPPVQQFTLWSKFKPLTRTVGLEALAGRGWYATQVKEFTHHRLKPPAVPPMVQI